MYFYDLVIVFRYVIVHLAHSKSTGDVEWAIIENGIKVILFHLHYAKFYAPGPSPNSLIHTQNMSP